MMASIGHELSEAKKRNLLLRTPYRRGPVLTIVNWNDESTSNFSSRSRFLPGYNDDNLYGRITILQRPSIDEKNFNSVTTLKRFPTRVIDDECKESCQACVICYQDWKTGENVKTLPCFHYYHADCINQWLHCKPSCPMCRANVNTFE
jgi:hypothetical protein